jgi:hypothetical protein
MTPPGPATARETMAAHTAGAVVSANGCRWGRRMMQARLSRAACSPGDTGSAGTGCSVWVKVEEVP